MNLVRLTPAEPRCHGYSNCCQCPNCRARMRGVADGDLFYDLAGQLRLKAVPKLKGNRAVAAYMRELERRERVLRRAA